MYTILLLLLLFTVIFIKNIKNIENLKMNNNIEYFKNKKTKKTKKNKKNKKQVNENLIDMEDYDNYIELKMKPLPLRKKENYENIEKNMVTNQSKKNNVENYDNINNVDNYGFSKQDNSDENNKSFININFKKIFIFILILIILLTLLLSGYIAWNEFYHDPIWIKLMKTWLAILFCPAYLTYIFFKSILFNLNTNSMMK